MANSVSRRLSVRQTLFLGIASLLTLFLLYELARGAVPWYDVLGAYLAGLPIGYALGRMLKVRWHESDEQAISETDAAGTIALVVYIAFAASREWILGHWFAAALVLPISLALAAGLLLGRYLAIRDSINRVLRAQRRL
ncbi:MAG TPA: hypothetical protein VHC68_01345 [Candidatus Paceibacterota bacterium]|nr:hypothetical protein [Candidatus Paceibacterota bacterium]